MAKQSQSNRKPPKSSRRDEQLLEVIQRLREDEKAELYPDEAHRLNASLGQYLSHAKQPENREEAIRKAVERIEEYPIVRQQFSEILDKSVRWYKAPEAGDFVSLSGELFDIDPGKLMVCPVDPTHYQRYRRNARQKLRCPHHDVYLKPADDFPQIHHENVE